MTRPRILAFILGLLTIALIVGLILFQAWQTAFDARLYATMTAIH